MHTPTPAVVLDRVTLNWPDGQAPLTEISGTFGAERTGLVGRNGAGKSTLLRLITGELTPTTGRLTASGGVATLPQRLTLDVERPVADLLGVGTALRAIRALEAGDADPAHVEAVGDDWDVEARAHVALADAGLSPDVLDRNVGELSGGESVLAALAGIRLRVMRGDAEITLLDEPTNNLDRDARHRLYGLVRAWRGALIVVSHDLALLELMDATAELYAGGLTTFGGPYSHWRAWLEGEQDAAGQAERAAAAELRKEKRQRIELQTRLARRERTGAKAQREGGIPTIVAHGLAGSAEVSAGKARGTARSREAAARAALDEAGRRVRDDDRIAIDLPHPGVATSRQLARLGAFTMRGPERVALTGRNGVGKTSLLERLVASAPHDPGGTDAPPRRASAPPPGAVASAVDPTGTAHAELLTDRYGYLPQRVDGLDDTPAGVTDGRDGATRMTGAATDALSPDAGHVDDARRERGPGVGGAREDRGVGDVLESFSPATQAWFRGAFHAPTSAQEGAWAAISRGRHALVVAPTGSGKTLSAFLWAIDRVFRESPPATNAALFDVDKAAGSTGRTRKPKADPTRTRILYISPLKALGVDVERNLRSPLVGIAQSARRLGVAAPEVTVGVRSGDTPSNERQRLVREPPDILITTPESLYLMLTSQAASTLLDVHTVIIDEVHAVAATKRGAHLAVSLERLDALRRTHGREHAAQRIGLSATVRPIDEVARFLGGAAPVDIVAPPSTKEFDLRVSVPLDDMSSPPPAGRGARAAAQPADGGPVVVGDIVDDEQESWSESSTRGDAASGDDWFTEPAPESTGSVWPHVEEAIVDRVLENSSTIVFVNSRRLAERLTARLNEIYAERLGLAAPDDRAPGPLVGGLSRETATGAHGSAPDDDDIPVLAMAHHGSVSKEQRAVVEEGLKAGRLRCVVATSSLELGIDMGAVDLVIQVESPASAASGLQRVGRAGHQVGEVSRAYLFPKHRADVLHTAIVTERMLAGTIEAIRVPQNPLDILAQQTVAATALEPLDVEAWFETVKRSAPFRSLPRSAYEATLDLLSGRYPSDEFAELRPRIVWDRDAGTITGRPGAQRLAVTSGGTIPDRGMFGVFVAGESVGARVGELDEEMVYESRVNEVFTLGTTSWRIVEITHDRVNVVPAFGQPGKLPFWHGDGLGRPAELGEALGRMSREVSSGDPETAAARLRDAGLDDRAIDNLLSYLSEQREATGHVPTDRTLTVERSRDEVGDWRIILHSPYGMHVHAPWALAVGARIRERLGVEGSAVASDDGIIARVPDTEGEPPGSELFVFEAEELEHIVTTEVGGSALFASRFRECAARALLMPRTNPSKRSPLWQQRQRSAQLLEVAHRHPTFPIILETLREVLQDVYDLPALLRIARSISERRIRLVETTTAQPSPFARDLLFGYVGAFMYEGDSPLAERRAAALSVDPALLGELLGRVEMRELLDPDVIAQFEREVQRLDPARRARGVEGVADLLRILGPLTAAEVAARLDADRPGAAPAGRPEPDAAEETSEASAPVEAPASLAAAEAHLDQLVSAKRAIRVQIAGRPVVATIEDAGRLRDALGSALPVGVPAAFTEPVADPLGDLVARYARTHGPFTTGAVADRLGIGTAVARATLQRLESSGRLASGFFLPADSPDAAMDETEWSDAEVLRRLRMRSLAAIRGAVEPVAPEAFARFLPAWQHVSRPLEGVDGVLAVIEQLAGVPIPASAWESLVLPGRVRDYSPAMLDELTATGEVLWSGHGSLPGRDGWVALHPAEVATLTIAPPEGEIAHDSLDRGVLDALAGGGAYFAAQLRAMTDAENEQSVLDALWRLTWSGRVTNDTFAPVRSLLQGGSQAHRVARRTPRSRMYRGSQMPRPATAVAPRPTGVGGRWSLLPEPEGDATVRAAAAAGILLDRYGVVTRGSVQAEGQPGGFAQAYRVLAGFEQAGHCRRGYIIEKLGAAQFAASATIDRIRTFQAVADPPPREAVTLAATDPASPYGAALPWPALEGVTHRPGRKAGGLVTLVDGALVLYLERGGRSALAFTDDPALLQAAAHSLVETARVRRLDTLTVEQVSGEFVYGTAVGRSLRDAGFVESPRGLTLRRLTGRR